MATKKAAKKTAAKKTAAKKAPAKKKSAATIALALGNIGTLEAALENKYRGLDINSGNVRVEPQAEEFSGYVFEGVAGLPGCCGIVVLHGLNFDILRDSDIAPEDHAKVIAVAVRHAMDEEEVAAALVTTIPSQKDENAILPEIGFVPVHTFTSPRSNNVITTWILNTGN
jgi:hypothetical protein